MTELMNVLRLREMTGRTDRSGFMQPDIVPVLRWTIDEATGRAVSRWVLEEKQSSSQLSL